MNKIKALLARLYLGLAPNDLDKDEKAVVELLLELDVAFKSAGRLFLHSNYLFGEVLVEKNGSSYLRALPGLDFRLKATSIRPDDRVLARSRDARAGDLVVCVDVGRFKSKRAAILHEVIFRSQAFLIAVVRDKNLCLELKNGVLMAYEAQKAQKAGTVIKISPQGLVQELLGHIDDPLVDEKITLGLFSRPSGFSQAALNEARAFGQEVEASMHPDRLDLRHLPFCTIDPKDAKDYDDAVCLAPDGTLYVAIADVSFYVSAFSSMDKEALLRGFSLYLPHKSYPMLPKELSSGICSLNPNEDRLCLGFAFKDEKLQFFTALIRSKRRFAYEELEELWSKNANLGEFSYLYKLRDLTQSWRDLRLKGAMDLRSAKFKLLLDEKQSVIGSKKELSSSAHQLIEECMLKANKAASLMIVNGIFRNHQSPSPKALELLIERLFSLGIEVEEQKSFLQMAREISLKAQDLGLREEVDSLLVRCMKRANYGSENLGHFALGFARYSHFTSPIRRYTDLFLHRLIKASKDEKELNYLLSNAELLCMDLSAKEREVELMERDFSQRKLARWAKEHVDEDFDAFVVDDENFLARLDNSCTVHIKNPPKTGLLLFSKVKIKIKEADILMARVEAYLLIKN